MGKLEDWARCACYNRYTLTSALGIIPCAGLFRYATQETDPVMATMGGLLASVLAGYSIVGLVFTGAGMDTFYSYRKTKRILSKRGYVPDSVDSKNGEYCDRRGIELAILDFEEKKLQGRSK